MAVSERHPVPVGEDSPIMEVMATMRAMRRLRPDPVPRELLERLVEAATWAPSGSNAQAFTYLIVTERDRMAELAPLWRACVDWYLDTVGSHTPESMDEARYSRMVEAIRFQADSFDETPALIACCYGLAGLRRRVFSRPGRLLRGAGTLGPVRTARLGLGWPRFNVLAEASSIYPGVQNLLLAARANGLAANVTVWHLAIEGEWRRALGLPRSVRPYALVPVGWPRGRFGPVRRRPASEAIRWERW